MSRFLSELEAVPDDSLKKALGRAKAEQVKGLLGRINGRESPGLDGLAALVSPAAEGFLEDMARLARSVTARRFGRTVQLYAPLYISNHCTNACVYCGFNAGNRVARRTLTVEEVDKEARTLHDRRLHQLLLVTGECPEIVPPRRLAETAARLKGLFPSIAVEVYPMDEGNYRELVRAGCDGLAIYQETYDPELYRSVHPSGPKRDFAWRLGAPERGGRAGFRHIGIGSLLGLGDWRLEACRLYLHARFLMRHYWRSQVSISFPRLRPASGGFQPPHPVSDRDLVQMICALRLALPDAGLVLSTRESPELRDSMAGIGITRISAGSRTSPGGYLDEQGEAEQQFSVHDGRTVGEVAAAVRARGYDPVWKDWDAGFEGQPEGRSKESELR